MKYSDAGVNVEAAKELVQRILPLAAATRRPEVLDEIGGFAGAFCIDRSRWREPVLLGAADGVGTKIKIAEMAGRFDTIGIDLVAMNVNDLICQGAEPLFFLDYLAVGKLEVPVAESIVEGIAQGCQLAGCALLGGETAEMPDVYEPGAFDLAGFAVGIAERDRLLHPSMVRPGDVLIGLSSSGLHSCGYALVRRVLFDVAGLAPSDTPQGFGRPLSDVLLEPTRIYVKSILSLRECVEVHGIVHVTTGAFAKNVPRALPPGMQADIHRSAWEVPPVFRLVQERGGVDEAEMYATLNMGIGMIVIVPQADADECMAHLSASGEGATLIGRVSEGDGGVVFID